MGYEKQGFKNGLLVEGFHLEKIEDGIITNQTDIEDIETKISNIQPLSEEEIENIVNNSQKG